MRLIPTIFATTLLCTASVAMAQQTKGIYLGLGAGWNQARDADISGSGISNSVEFDSGWAGIGSIGYGYGNGLRTEFEVGYRSNDVDSITGTTSGGGSANVWSFMVNGIYDIATSIPLTPYIGAGIGFARVEYDSVGPLTGGARIDDSDGVFAYQGIAGLAYAITDNIKATLDYRYFGTVDPSFSTNTGVKVDGEYSAHTVLLGLRYEFGAPRRPAPTPAVAIPPAPPPAPAPAPVVTPPPAPPAAALQRSFLVFFDFDRSNITQEADRVIREAAANAKRGNVSRITATGHADRAGPEKYNMALSLRRADAVKAVLVREGIPANQIVVVGKGETQPLVPTADGVREPQNRRVEIVLQ